MSFDFSTLVTDRLQSDVDQRNAKGTYNAADLNRVTAAMEALDEMFRAYGYHSGYTPIFVASRGGQSGQLPEGYTKLLYIESSGTQYIDTGFIPNQDTRVVCSFELLTDNGGRQVIFGARISSSSGQYLFGYAGHRSPPHWRSDYNTTQSNFPSSIPRSGRYEVDKDGNVTQLDSETVQAGAATFTAVVSMYLFAGNTNGVVENQSSMKLYACQIYDGDAMVRNFVPCTDPDGVVGLYDAVNGMFYANAGTGVFSDGPAVPPEPEPEPGPVLDPYTWYESDIPLQSQMAQYLANLAALRGVLSQVAAEPPTPESMELLTYVEANDIEQILLNIEAVLTTIGESFLRAGMTWAVAGGPEIFARNGGTA